MSWVMAAVASAFFAGITSILAKCGLSETDSDVATALRTLVVLVFAWIMVAVVGSGNTVAQLNSAVLVVPCSFRFGNGRFVDLLLQGAFSGQRKQGCSR